MYPGITTTPPPTPILPGVPDSQNLAVVFPDPTIEITESNFTRATVNAYSVKLIQAPGALSYYPSPPRTQITKILKTGSAVTQRLTKIEPDEEEEPPPAPIYKLITETFSFEYLTNQVITEGTSWDQPLSPASPRGSAGVDIIKFPPGFGRQHLYGESWKLSSYSVNNYADVYETKYSYEVVARMYRYVDETDEDDINKPAPPLPPSV